jgi:putative oxidoreductase
VTPTRWIARPLLASVFVTSGVDVLRNPEPRVKAADPVATRIAGLTGLPDDTELLVKINAGVQIGAGVLLAWGKFPRLSAALLAGSLVPTTIAGHRYWEELDEAKRHQQQIHFFKNLGLLGGLILAAVDTEGAPSLAWRARHRAGAVREHLPL